MVRLVFRPYTQVRRSICTSESLQASTRVSPGFTLLRHSSPSFGSQQTCSHSDHHPVGLGLADWATVKFTATFTFISHIGLTPLYSHACWTPWSVFQDGWKRPISYRAFHMTRAKKLLLSETPWTTPYHIAPATSSRGNTARLPLGPFRYLPAISGTL